MVQVNIDNIDKELPQVQVGLGSKTSNSITVNIEVTDNEGELEGQEYVYKIKKTTERISIRTQRKSRKWFLQKTEEILRKIRMTKMIRGTKRSVLSVIGQRV